MSTKRVQDDFGILLDEFDEIIEGYPPIENVRGKLLILEKLPKNPLNDIYFSSMGTKKDCCGLKVKGTRIIKK